MRAEAAHRDESRGQLTALPFFYPSIVAGFLLPESNKGSGVFHLNPLSTRGLRKGVHMKRSILPFWIQTLAPEIDEGGSSEVESTETDETTTHEGGDSEEDSDESSGDEEDSDEGEDQLGDAGKKALDRMKAKWQSERDKRKQLQEKYEPASKEEAAGNARFAQKILRSEIKAAPAGKLNDPADAHRFLDLEQFEVGEDGEVDEDEIALAIDDLVKKKPYLAATQGQRRNRGSADGGVRNESTPAQLTRADLARMSPQQILKAEKEGRLNKLKGN